MFRKNLLIPSSQIDDEQRFSKTSVYAYKITQRHIYLETQRREELQFDTELANCYAGWRECRPAVNCYGVLEHCQKKHCALLHACVLALVQV
jgi:hypothetical protein